MYLEPMVSLSIVTTVAFFSLAWFVLGILIGRQVAVAPVSRRQRRPVKRSRGGKYTEIYIGNLPYSLGEKEVRKMFSDFGKVASVRIIKNQFNGKSKGYGFVEMFSDGDAGSAIKTLNGKEHKGRKIVVNEAKTRSRK